MTLALAQPKYQYSPQIFLHLVFFLLQSLWHTIEHQSQLYIPSKYYPLSYKLRDHLHIMSDFKLNVASPYPRPEIKKLSEKPVRMKYPGNKIKFSYYGITIPNMIQTALKLKGVEKEVMTGMIANQMKKSYILFNESSVDNNIIKLHLKQLSNEKLKLADDFQFIRSASVRQAKNSYKKNNGKKKIFKKNYKKSN